MTPKSAAILLVVAIVAFVTWFVVREATRGAGPCVDEVYSPDSTFTRCQDPRQRLTVPPGWTWFKCECPKEEDRR